MIIRRYKTGDAKAIAALIHHSLIEINSQDYSKAVIRKLINYFTPHMIEINAQTRQTLCAIIDGNIIGTVSLDHDTVYTLFVHPSYQRRGVGRGLMGYIEKTAKIKGIQIIHVPSSITALNFYKNLGYKKVSTTIFEDSGGKIILMTKELT